MAFGGAQRTALRARARPAHLLALYACGLLLPLPRSGLYGRGFSGAVLAGLRKVLRPHRDSFCRSVKGVRPGFPGFRRPGADYWSSDARFVAVLLTNQIAHFSVNFLQPVPRLRWYGRGRRVGLWIAHRFTTAMHAKSIQAIETAPGKADADSRAPQMQEIAHVED